MAFRVKVEDCDEWKKKAKKKDFHFKSVEEHKMGEKSDYEPMLYEEDNQSMDKGLKFAVVTLQDTDEVMVVASDWLSIDKKQSYWPPFKSTEKYLEVVKNNLQPSTGGKPWEKLNVIFHAEYDTYEEAVNNQVEQRALKYGRTLFKVVTLQESNEVTVIPATWLNEEKTQCYWPPFKSPEKCTEAVRNRLEPPVTVEKPWEMLNIQVHMECATYKQAMEKQKSVKEQRERFPVPFTLPQISPHDPSIPLWEVREVLEPIPTSQPEGRETPSSGTKRKRESPDWRMNSPLTMDMIMENVRQIMKKFTKNLDQIDRSRKKATIGIFGKSGEGKSSLLSAVLGKKDLLPSGCYGACTAIVTQVEANLTDYNYIAEIELISKEEWEKELEDLFRVLSDESEDRDDELFEISVEKITAVYGADAKKKTLEELKKDAKFAEIQTFLSTNEKKSNSFSKSDVSEFSNDVASYILHSQSSPGGWYWPLVKSVKVKIPDCRELLEHIVLVDFPGSGDCNKIRDDLWKSKLRECSSVWIISAINRASTDKESWGILNHCIEELGPGGECKHINFICTKTDEINSAAYIRSTRLPRDQIPKEKDQKNVCILHRNENTKMKVKENFEKSELKKIFSTDNQFQVFSVSSSAFFDQSLNLESSETEIPKLQDELRSLNKSMSRELVRDYVNEAKGTLLLIQSGQLYTDKKMMEMKVKELEKNLMKALSKLDKYFHGISSDLEQCLSQGVEKSVKSCVDSTMKLIMELKKDGRGFHKILRALCKNYGCYSGYWVVLDLNKTLAENLHKCILEDFSKIFPVTGKTGKSVQEQIDKFSIIQSDSANPSSPLQHIENFIKIEETKLKTSLSREIVDMKKLIYSSIKTTIQNEMASCYEEAAAVTGTGSMKKRQKLLMTTVENIKEDMFNKAKTKVLKKLNNLKLHIMNALEKKLKKAIECSQSQTSKIIRDDVSGYIEQLERMSDQLSD